MDPPPPFFQYDVGTLGGLTDPVSTLDIPPDSTHHPSDVHRCITTPPRIRLLRFRVLVGFNPVTSKTRGRKVIPESGRENGHTGGRLRNGTSTRPSVGTTLGPSTRGRGGPPSLSPFRSPTPPGNSSLEPIPKTPLVPPRSQKTQRQPPPKVKGLRLFDQKLCSLPNLDSHTIPVPDPVPNFVLHFKWHVTRS